MSFANAVIGIDEGLNRYLQTHAQQQAQAQERQMRQLQMQEQIARLMQQRRADAARSAAGRVQGLPQLSPPGGGQQPGPTPAPAPGGGAPPPAMPAGPIAPSPAPAAPPGPPQAAPAPQAAPQMAGSPGPQAPAADFSPDAMVAMRTRILQAVRQANPDIDDETASEAADDFIESAGKLRSLMAPSQQIIERQITTEAAGQRQDKSLAAAGERQDKSLADADRRQDERLQAEGQMLGRRLAQSESQFQRREADIDRRLAERGAKAGPQNAIVRAKVAAIKAQRQRAADAASNILKNNNGVTPTDPAGKAALARAQQQMDTADAAMVQLQTQLGAGSAPQGASPAPADGDSYPLPPKGKYKSAQDVVKAQKGGQLSYDQAAGVLKRDFGVTE